MIQNPRRLHWGKQWRVWKKDYPAAPPTLKVLDQDYHDAVAKGLFMPLNTFKFIGAIYILHQVIPILHTVSKSSQKGFVTSHIAQKKHMQN